MRRFRNEIVVCFALAALTLGALGHVCWNGFTNYDDNDYVVRNRQVKAGLSRDGLAWALTTTQAANWHPLTWLSLELDATLYGPDAAWGFHLTNLLLHTTAVVLLFLALRRLTGALWRSALVAALFAVHPLHVESVAWVAERKDVLSGVFWMLALLAYAWYAERPGWGRYLLLLTAFALGLMAKPMLVTLPCVLLLLDYWPLGRMKGRFLPPPSSILLEKLPLFALTAAACLVTVYAQKKGGAVNTLEQVPLSERLMNSLAAYAAYLGKLAWPTGLAPFYPHPHGRLLLEQAVRAGLVLAGITALVLWARRGYLLVGWLWFLGTLVPVIGLVQVGSQGMADRYSYLPSVGLFLALVWGAADLAARRPASVPWAAAPAALLLGVWVPLALWLALGPGAELMAERRFFLPVGALSVVAVLLGWVGRRAGLWPGRLSPLVPAATLLLGVCVALTAWQARLWHNSIWLWEYTVAVTTDNMIGHNNLGDAYWNSRHPERARRRENFESALRLLPTNAKAHNNLGLVYLSEGRLDRAGQCFERARECDPRLAVAPHNLGTVRARQGRFEEAIALQREALSLDPGSTAAWDGLGRALAGSGDWEGAAKAFGEAAGADPGDKDVLADLAWALRHLGRAAEAAERYAAVVGLDAEWPENARQSAWAWATAAEARGRNGFEAVRLAEQACQAHAACDARFLDTLAAAYAEDGRFPEAVEQATRALALAGGDGALAAEVQERLDGYREDRPYRSH